MRNAHRQARDYLVYFVTIILAAALVYAFNGLVFSSEIRDLSSAMDSLPLIIVLTSLVVVCIIGWLVHYTIGFMLTRRSRELGTYILIGMEARQVAGLFFLENLVVGGIALVFGILLGNLLFQALRAITLALFHVPYTFSFAFSIRAVGLTGFYFVLMYLFALLRGRRRIRKMKISELIYFDRKNEGEVIKKGSSRQRIFIMSIVFGIAGIILLLMRNLYIGILGSGCIIIFLYSFFISFSSGVPAYFEKHAAQKYRGQTLLIFRTLSSKLATMGIAMATIALLFTATLISEGTGLVFHRLFQSNAEQTTCFDLFISSHGQDETRFDDYLSYIDSNIPVKQARKYHIYKGENAQVMDYITENKKYWGMFDYDTIMKASDYIALREMAGYPEVNLEPGRYAVHCMEYLKDVMEKYSQPVTAGGTTLKASGVFTETFTQYLWSGNGRGYILIVPDEVANACQVSYSVYAAMTTEPVSMEQVTALNQIRDEKDSMDTELEYDDIYSKTAVEADNANMYAMMVFPLFYLSLVLTMVSATILTIQQLSETGLYKRQFELLHKLGMERHEMKKALRKQFTIYYAMPAIPPLFISIPLVLAMCNTMDPGVLTSTWQSLQITGMMLGLFFFIYMLYILMGYTTLHRNVLPE